MISSKHFATLHVSRVIFHDVPRKKRGEKSNPVLSEIDSSINPAKVNHLKLRLTRALQSKAAYDIQFNPKSLSPVPDMLRELTHGKPPVTKFVELSQKMAAFLHEQQTGTSSPGLLTVLEAVSDGKPAVVVLKLEREEGAQLERSEKNGKKTYEMSVLDNLVLTEGTKLFKCAMFLRNGSGTNDFAAVAVDDQRPFGTGDELAQFWMRFLGVQVTLEPKVATKQFFEATVDFLNIAVPDASVKATIYESLLSQYKSNKTTFSPKEFLLDFIPEDYREAFEDHLQQQRVPVKQFHLDVADVAGRLKRRAYRTSKGAMVTVPEDADIGVDIDEKKITVQDQVIRVDHK